MRLASHRIAAEAHYLLPQCAGDAPGVFALLARELAAARLPGVHWQMESLTTGLARTFVGAAGRAALVIGARSFPEFRVVVTAADHGATTLAVNRFLVMTPTVWGDLKRALLPFAVKPDRTTVGRELDPLRRAELGAWDALVDDLLQRALHAVLRERARAAIETDDEFGFDAT